MKGLLAFAGLIVAVMLLAGQKLGDVHPLSGQPSTLAPSTSADPGTPPAAHFAGEGIAIARDAGGQFHLAANVNGTPIRFLVDTGADTVALTIADAQAAGLTVNPNGFIPILRTASGEGYGTMVTLNRLEIGSTELHNVGAVVVKDLDVSLLGQSVLMQLGKVELQGDQMVLVPR